MTQLLVLQEDWRKMAAAAAVTCPREAESDGRGLGPVDSEAADATAVSVPR